MGKRDELVRKEKEMAEYRSYVITGPSSYDWPKRYFEVLSVYLRADMGGTLY